MKRRNFIKTVGTVAMAGGAAQAAPFNIIKNLAVSPNDKIRIATIGMGIQGHYDTKSALQNPGIELVGAADLYTGRLDRAKADFGKDLFTTRDYRELLNRKDIDAVLIVTPDHWHDKITIDALNAGKHVYCEKPMVQDISEGKPVIDAWKKSGKTMQVGSQRISGSMFQEAKRLIAAGEVGQVNYIESNNDRFSAIGAWNYSIPTDASPATVDWDTFLKDTHKMDFDANRFFRWRNYKDYGTGVAGDLFVHLITGVHYVMDSKGPERIYASGGLRYWKEGRDVPDVMVAILDYPKEGNQDPYQMVLRVNFANAGKINNNTRIIGSEGQIDLGYNSLTLSKKTLPKAPGYGGYDSYFTFNDKEQADFKKQYEAKYSEVDKIGKPLEETTFKSPEGENEHVNHFGNFFENVRKGSQDTIEDPIFAFRAAAPVLACNKSYFENKAIDWDPEQMQLK